MSSTRSRLMSFALCAIFALLATAAFATHFKYGYMFWERDLTFTSADPNLVRVKVTVDAGGRWTYPSYTAATPIVGFTSVARCSSGAATCCAGVVTSSTDMNTLSCPNLGSLFQFSGGTAVGVKIDMPAGGTIQVYRQHLNQTPTTYSIPNAGGVFPAIPSTLYTVPMTPVVQQILPTQDTFYGRMTFYLVFDKRNPVRLTWENGARLSTLLDGNNDVNWKLQAMIDLTSANAGVTKSPIAQAPAVMTVFSGVTNTVTLPSQTFDNTIAKWRIATSAESSLTSPIPVATGGSAFSLDPNTGVVQFRPRSVGVYAVQFILEAYDNLTTPPTLKSAVPLDVMFQAVLPTSTSSTLSTADGLTSYTATVPNPFSFQVKSTTVPANSAYTVTINPGVLPAGATFTQPACNAASVCTGTFNWTPMVNSTGSVVCFTSTVTSGVTLITTSAPMCVTVNLNPLETRLIVDPASGASGGGPVTLRAQLTRSLDNAPLPVRSVTFTFDASPGNPPWTGTSTVLTDSLGWATANLTLVRTVNPPSSFTATFNSVAGELLASASASNVLSSRVATTSLNPPIVATSPLPTVGYATTASAVLNRIYTDGGTYGVGQDGVTFTVTPPGGGSPATVNGGTTGATGVSAASLPAPTTTGIHSVSAFFAGNDNLIGPAQSVNTNYQVYRRTQLTMSAGIASVNVASQVAATLVAIPSDTPIAGKMVTFSAPGQTDQTIATDGNGVARATFTFASLGLKAVTASYTPAGTDVNRNGLAQVETSVANTDVQPAQNSTTTVTTVNGFAGGPATLTAHVQVASSSAPISGGTVAFDIVGGGNVGVGSTNANGDVSIVFYPPAAGSFSYTASFSGVPGFAGSSATGSLNVGSALTALSTLSVPAMSFVGDALNVSTMLTRESLPAGPLGNQPVVFTITRPSGGVITQFVMADSAGRAASDVILPTRGQYSITASFAGTAALAASSSTATVNAYERTTLTLNPLNGIVGSSTAVSATLLATPSGLPLAGQTVTFSFGGVIPDQTVVTNSTGQAEVSGTFNNAGSYPVSASFQNLASLYVDANGNQLPTIGTGTVVVAKASTSLSSLTAPSTGLVGNAITVNTVLTRNSASAGGAQGETVTFTVTGPGGSTALSGSAVTAAGGQVSYTFTPTERGVHTVTAAFAATSSLESSAASAASVSAYQRVQLTVAPVVGAIAGSQVTVSATVVALPSNAPITGQLVTFSTSVPGVGPTTMALDGNGVATAALVFPRAETVSVTGTFVGDFGEFFADRNGQLVPDVDAASGAAISVGAAISTLSALSMPATSQVGSAIVASTILTAYGGTGMPAADISFLVTQPNGQIDTLQAMTQSNGSASVTFTASQPGVYSVVAQYAGNSAVTAASTGATSLTVGQATALTLSSATGAAGTTLTVQATLTAIPGGTVLAGQSVTFTFTGVGAPAPVTSVTDASGVASASQVFAVPGTFSAQAAFSNAAAFYLDATAASTVTATNNAPTFTAPADITTTATSAAGAVVTFTVANGNDQEDGPIVPVCSANSGATFPIATTTVTCTVTDSIGAASSDSFTITVTNSAPTFTPPANMTVQATGPGGAVVTFTLTGNDVEDGVRAAVCTPASGSTFALGGTTVSCTVTDTAGVSASGAFTVNVVDTTAPTLTLPANITTNPTGPTGAAVSFTASASDIVTFPLSPVCSPVSGATFVIGSTTVNCSATDAANNTASGSFTVTVRSSTQATQDLQQVAAAAGMSQGDNNVDNVLKFLNKQNGGSLNAACNNLNSVINKASKLPPAQAALVIAAANDLKATIGCTP